MINNILIFWGLAFRIISGLKGLVRSQYMLWFFQGELMRPDEERPKEKIDVFEIGIYAIEVGITAAIIYAMIELPMLLRSTPS